MAKTTSVEGCCVSVQHFQRARLGLVLSRYSLSAALVFCLIDIGKAESSGRLIMLGIFLFKS